MSKLRPRTVSHLHSLLADATSAWDEAGQSESLHRYVLAHGAAHLRAVEDQERLWQLLRSEQHRRAQLETFQQYEAPYRALREGIELYVERDGAMPADDPRLCWLALRAGELGDEAKRNVQTAFDWMNERPLEDASRVHDVVERLSILENAEFYRAAMLLLWIEADRQASLPETERSSSAARSVLEAVEERTHAEPARTSSTGLGLSAWIILRAIEVFPDLDVVACLARLASPLTVAESLVEAVKVRGRVPADSQIQLIMTFVQMAVDGNETSYRATGSGLLADLGRVLLAHGETDQAVRLFERAIASLPDSYHASDVLAEIVDATAAIAELPVRSFLLHGALAATRQLANGTSGAGSYEWKALPAIAVAMARAGDVEVAVGQAEGIENPAFRAAAFAGIAGACADAGSSTQARHSLQCAIDATRATAALPESFATRGDVDRAFTAVMEGLGHAGDLAFAQDASRELLDVARTIEDVAVRSRCLARVGVIQMQNGLADDSRTLMREAVTLAETVRPDHPKPGPGFHDDRFDKPEPSPKSHSLSAIAALYARAGELRDAMVALQLVRDDYWKKQAIEDIIAVIESHAQSTLTDVLQQALEMTRSMEDDSDRYMTLQALSDVLARSPEELPQRDLLFEQALAVVRSSAHDNGLLGLLGHDRDGCLVEIARSLHRAGLGARAQSIMREVVHSMSLAVGRRGTPDERSLREFGWGRRAAWHLVEPCIEIGLVDVALSIVEETEDAPERSRAVGAAADALIRAGREDQAREVFRRSIGKPDPPESFATGTRAFAALARGFVKVGQPDAAAAIALEISHYDTRSKVLAEIVDVIAGEGALDRCVVLVKAMPIPELRSEAWRLIARESRRAGLRDQAHQMLDEACRSAREIRHEATRSSVIAQVATDMFEAGYRDDALACLLPLDAIEAIGTAERMDGRLAAIARAFIRAGKPDLARQIVVKLLERARTLQTESDRCEALGSIVAAAARLDGLPDPDAPFEAAVLLAESIRSPGLRCRALTDVALAMDRAGYGRASEILLQARACIDELSAPAERAAAHTRMVRPLVAAGRAEQAVEAAREALAAGRSVDDRALRTQSLAELAEQLPLALAPRLRGEALSLAHEASRQVTEASVRAKALIRVADAHVSGGSPAEARALVLEALTTVRRIRDPIARWDVLTDIADALVRVGDPRLARRVLRRALRTARLMDNHFLRVTCLVRVTDGLMRADGPREAVRVFEEAVGPAEAPTETWLWSKYVFRGGRAGEPMGYGYEMDVWGNVTETNSFEDSDREEPDHDGSLAVAAIVKTLLESKQYQTALAAADVIPREAVRVSSLIGIASHLKAANSNSVESILQRAADAARRIDNTTTRSRLLADVVKTSLRTGELELAYVFSLDIEDADQRAEQLVTVAEARLVSGLNMAESLDVIGHALNASRLIHHPGLRTMSLLKIGGFLSRSGQPSRALSILDEALESSRSVKDKRPLLRVAEAFAEIGQLERALTIASWQRADSIRNLWLGKIGEIAINANDLAASWKALGLMRGDGDRYMIATAAGRRGMLSAAVQIVETIRDECQKASALIRTAEVVAETELRSHASAMLGAAIDSIGRISGESSSYDKSEALKELTRTLKVSSNLPNRVRLFERALATAFGVGDDRRRWTVEHVLENLLDSEGAGPLLAVIAAQDSPAWKAEKLIDTAEKLLASGDTAYAVIAFEQAMAAAGTGEGDARVPAARAGMVRALALQGEVDRALAVGRAIQEPHRRAEAMTAIAAALIDLGNATRATGVLDEALAAAGAVEDANRKGELLRKLGENLARAAVAPDFWSLIEDFLQEARSLDPDAFAQILDDLRGIPNQNRRSVAVAARAALGGLDLTGDAARRTASRLVRVMMTANAPDLIDEFVRSADPGVHVEIVREWREALTNQSSEGALMWLRRSMLHDSFSGERAFDGVRALHRAHLRHHDTFDAIIRHCPQLGLDFLIPEN